MSRRDKDLSLEDRILWMKVARTTSPMPGRSVEAMESDEADFAALLGEVSSGSAAPTPETAHTPPPRPGSGPGGRAHIDRPTRQKLERGRLPIEAKVDLHGLTQGEAHGLLLSFLRRAQAQGRRHVLVVTGKGASSGSEGVLRRAVPGWFATPPFRPIVSAHETAARRHGGEGALYVRLHRHGGPA